MNRIKKTVLVGLLALIGAGSALAVDVKISQLPLGSAASSGGADSFPYVAASTNITKRLTLWDLSNIPTITSTYATKASPTFTGTVTAPTFAGALTGNASTATALASNPTDCSSDQFANAIAANGNLTCSAITPSQLSGTVTVTKGGTGITSGTAGGLLAFTASTTAVSTTAGSSGNILRSAGTAAPTWSSATYPSTTTANRILYSSATNVVDEIATAATSALVTNSSSVPSLTSGAVANRVLRTDGSAITFSQVAAATDISGQLAIGNGGTGQSTKAAAFDALSPNSAKGDLTVRNSSSNDRLPVGNNDDVLTADSTQTLGVKWVATDVSLGQSYQLSNLGLASSVAASALTFDLKTKAGTNPSASDVVRIGFRNSTATTGTYSQSTATGAVTITVPSTATLGHTSARAEYVFVYAISNSGTIELGVSGQKLFDEGALVTTTAISSSANSGQIMYSTSARSNVAARLIGRASVTEATAGTWATAPSQLSLIPFRDTRMRTCSAKISYSGGSPVTSQDYCDDGTDWVNGNPSDDGTGQYTISTQSGVWTAPPNCTCSAANTIANYLCTQSTSATASSIAFAIVDGNSGAKNDQNSNVMCQGPI